ncbi:MAG: alkaline phosphatase family protein [Candidatus Cybelea sp.]
MRSLGGFGFATTPDGASSLSLLGNSKIKHVVIIIQENRSFDNLFHQFPGADSADYGETSNDSWVKLFPEKLTEPMDISHTHGSFAVEFNAGKMNGFNLAQSRCGKDRDGSCRNSDLHPYGFVPQSEIRPYWAMASQYVLADRMFQTNEGPSFPAHQYLVSGTSTISNRSNLRAAENAALRGRGGGQGGCDSSTGATVRLIDLEGNENQKIFPCFTRISLMGRIDAAGLTWHYYEAHRGHGIWNAPDAIRSIRYGPFYKADVISPQTKVLHDIAHGELANVVWVTPSKFSSDHAGVNNGSGPAWVASVVNAIGESRYWNDTAIFLTWDDWGGWYDHVKPPQYNSYELSFRVPLIVISAYARQNYVSHREHEFGSILKFTEKVFGLRSLGTTDVRSDDLDDCFNFFAKPRRFKRIPAALPPSYFENQPVSNDDPDDDF